MEQVFELVNILLVEDSATARRDLKIRTYRIVPLRSKTGVLEFVSNSQSLQEVLSSTLEKCGVLRKLGRLKLIFFSFAPEYIPTILII